MVNGIFQDSDGLVWIASEDGLDVYDGVRFWHIKHVDDDPHTVITNYVRLVRQDDDGVIFVGTLHGLQYFDKNTQQYKLIPVVNDSGAVNIMPSISSFCQLGKREYLVSTSGYGVMRLRYEDKNLVMRNIPELGGGNIGPFYKDGQGYIWLAYRESGVKKLDANLNVLDSITFPHSESVNAIAADHDGNVFFGTARGRIMVYDAGSPAKCREIVSSAQNGMAVQCFYVDDDNTVLVGTDGRGVRRLVHDNGQWVLREYEFATIDNSRLKVHDIMRDREGNYWFGCFQRGVVVKRNGGNVFDYVGRSSLLHDVIGECCVTALFSDKDRNMYVGTDNDGIYFLNEGYAPIHHYESGTANSMVPNVTLSICEDSHGRLWVGGYQGGLVYLDRATGTWHRYELNSPSSSEGFDYASVYSIVEDKKTQTLWVSASGVGLYKINENTLHNKLFGVKYTTLQHDYSADQICNTWVVSMMISSDRKLYIGTYSGFSCMDLDTESFVNTYGVNCFMEGFVVNDICEAPNRHIWVGTMEGLYDFDPYKREFKRYGVDDGLVNNSISSIVADSDGNIWISSKMGISCLYVNSGKFVNYNVSDGLYCNEFMANAVCVSNSGRVSFGAVNGVASFVPFESCTRSRGMNLRIVNFVIDNVPINKGYMSGGHEIIDTSVLHARKFRLAPHDNSFEVEFSAIEFETPGRLVYSYRLDGGQWNMISGNRVSFAKLGYGKHTLDARVTDNIDTSDVLSVVIEIDYPWYRSTWFYLLVALLVVAAAMLAYHLVRRRMKLNRHIEELSRDKELNDSRIEYFTNISHEIRTPISLIISPLYKLMNSDPDVGRQRSYKVINVNAQRILNCINQLLDLRKIDSSQLKLEFEKVDLVSFCQGIYESFELHANNIGVEFEFETEEESIEAYIDPKNFDKVIVNLLSNAFKYTPKGKKVTLAIYRLNDGMVNITVKDQGSGLAEQDIDHIFDLFYQGSNSHKINVVGTGVGMYLARQLVTMHHGNIRAVNNPLSEGGCSFVIDLPLGREHLSDDEVFVRTEQEKQQYLPASAASEEIDDEELRKYSRAGIKLVIVDDDEQMRKYVMGELGDYFNFTDFSNAEDALQYIVKNKPQLVISDIMMGQMDGMTLCKKIKQNVDTNTIPVILLTATNQDTARIKALDIGADAYITKPFNISVLSHTVTNLLKRNATLKNSYLGNQTHVGEDGRDPDLGKYSPDKMLLKRVLRVINDNMSNPGLTVDMIAKEVGISRVHLHRKLKELTNQSTIDFLRNVRLNRALKLLNTKHVSILNVAMQVGFLSTSYFSTVFKDRFGCSPTAYMSENAALTQVPLDDDEFIAASAKGKPTSSPTVPNRS